MVLALGIIPRPHTALADFANQVAPAQLLPFIRRLINGTSKRGKEARWRAVNRQRLEIAKLCIDRGLTELLEEYGTSRQNESVLIANS